MARLLIAVLCICSVLLGACSPGNRLATDSHALFSTAAVACDHPIASDAGAEILAQGGNAVDAAVAASFTLSVVRPYSCGIGGGGFMVIHLPDDPTHGSVTTAINYRETSPVGPEFFERTGVSSTVGGGAVAVPGTVAGLLHALENYGSLDRDTVLAPAIRAAERGFIVDDHYAAMARGMIDRFEREPHHQDRSGLVWTHFLRSGRVEKGDRIRNPMQASVLRLIAREGRSGFDSGPVAAAIESAARRANGTLSATDLASYTPVEMRPMIIERGGLRFVSMPPPSSGGAAIAQTIGILAELGIEPTEPIDTASERHMLVEALRHAFADRSRWMGDPAFVQVPVDAMLDQENLQRMASQITDRSGTAASFGTHDAIPVDGGTSHLSVADQWGGAVACTETINTEFGSLVGVDEFGFTLNNEMDDFLTRRGTVNAYGLAQSDRNLPEIGKRPLSSMSPSIVLDNDGVLAIAGASGGPRIITGTLQVLLKAISGSDAGEAVGAPRLHHQWRPDRVDLEPEAQEWGEDLSARGHQVGTRTAVGNVQLILRDPSGRGWQAASDPRKGGRPAGVD